MSGEVITGAEMVIRAFRDQGVDTLFGYPGGAVLPIYDALFGQNQVRHVLVRQEGGAARLRAGSSPRPWSKCGCACRGSTSRALAVRLYYSYRTRD